MDIYTYINIYTHYKRMYIDIYIDIYTYIYTYEFKYAYIYICTYTVKGHCQRTSMRCLHRICNAMIYICT